MDVLAAIVAPLNLVLFRLGDDAVSSAELLGFVTGATCVWLTVRASVANFGVGIANSAFFLVLFLAARLYADAALQVVYIVLGAAGWWQWVHGGGGRSDSRPITVAGARLLLGCLAGIALATVGLTLVLRAVDDVAPFWDALTTALSLAAQLLLNLKMVQNWYFWISADLVYIPLYAVKHLDLTAVVYVLFLLMCLRGLYEWRRRGRAPGRPSPGRALEPA